MFYRYKHFIDIRTVTFWALFVMSHCILQYLQCMVYCHKILFYHFPSSLFLLWFNALCDSVIVTFPSQRPMRKLDGGRKEEHLGAKMEGENGGGGMDMRRGSKGRKNRAANKATDRKTQSEPCFNSYVYLHRYANAVGIHMYGIVQYKETAFLPP